MTVFTNTREHLQTVVGSAFTTPSQGLMSAFSYIDLAFLKKKTVVGSAFTTPFHKPEDKVINQLHGQFYDTCSDQFLLNTLLLLFALLCHVPLEFSYRNFCRKRYKKTKIKI